MAITYDNAFIQQWSDRVHILFQQKMTKLRRAVREEYTNSSKHTFHTLGSVTANTKSRHAEVTGLEPAHATVEVTLSDDYVPMYIDKLDENKTNVSFQEPYQKSQVAALGRALDDKIITALDGATPATVVDATSTGLTYAKVLEAFTALGENDVDPEDLFLIVSPGALGQALEDSKLTSADYVSVRNVMAGSIESAVGFNWIKSTRLSTAGSPVYRKCYAINKNAVGLAMGQDITTEINYIPQRVSTLVNSFCSSGASVIDESGIVEIQVNENA